MAPSQSSSGWRKGTVSCTECRRRKVRCVRLSDSSGPCRQCGERGLECIAQTSRQPPPRPPGLSSRHRIAHLESQVSQLTRIVHSIESRLGSQPSDIVAVSHDSDDAQSSASEVVVAEQPSHLRSLFQNDWLTVDTNRQAAQLGARRDRTSRHLLALARPKLQRLLPSPEDVSDITESAWDWLAILNVILPQPYALQSQRQVLEAYQEMCRPDVDVFDLASWLLTVAITAQQIPQGAMSPEVQSQKYRSRLKLCQNIVQTVESTVLSHDRLLGTAQGLGMAIHFLRLQIGQGNFQKAWIRLRHVIALAELLGLPKLHQAVRLHRLGDTTDPTASHKAQLWELICLVDRLLGMILNLPPATRIPSTTSPVVVNGTVQLQTFLGRLLDIAARVYYMDEQAGGKGHLELSGELGALASQTPSAWWVRDSTTAAEPGPADIVQFLHYCVLIRVHLPLALRQTSGPEDIYNRLACMDVCDAVAARYEFLARNLPPGFFVSRLLDLHAFIATVILLLHSHQMPSSERHSFRIDQDRLQHGATKVIDIMGDRSKAPGGADFAKEGFHTLCALRQLLQQDDHDVRVQDLTLKVPLLGKTACAPQSPTIDGHLQLSACST